MIAVGILTVSDSASQGIRTDESGPSLSRKCTEFGWHVAQARIVGDDTAAIAKVLRQWADDGSVHVILSTGGTGISPRDVTPEATRPVLDREIPGLGELMRREGERQTPFAVLARSLAGTRGGTLIVNLPGSPRGALSSLEAIRQFVPHIVDLLNGRTEHAHETPTVKETPRNP